MPLIILFNMLFSYPPLAGCEIPTPIYNPIKNQASFSDDVARMVKDTTYNTEEEGMNDFPCSSSFVAELSA